MPVRATTKLRAALLLALLLDTPPARAAEREACLEAHVAAQRLTKRGKLTRARRELVACGRERCPGPVRRECLGWLEELERALPSVVLALKGPDGSDVTDARVFVDGKLVAKSLDGRPLSLDPGPHRLRLERAGRSVEERVVVRQGEQARRITLVLRTEGARAPDDARLGEPSGEASGDALLVVSIVMVSLGVAALGTATGFAVAGKSEHEALRDGCGATGTCTDAEIDPVREKYLVADVLFTTGGVLGAVGIALFVYDQMASAPAAAGSQQLGPSAGSLGLGLRGAF
jgi:hypothetical protein